MRRSSVNVTRARPSLPEPVTRYFAHALAAGAPLARRVQVRMHGRIRVGGWLPFRACQVIDSERGFQWEATVAGGMIRGYDVSDGPNAATHFALFGRVPLVDAQGADIVRSARGRMLAEWAAWLPAALLPGPGAHWGAPDSDHIVVHVDRVGDSTLVAVTLGPAGDIRGIGLNRWGNPDGHGFGEIPFGMYADAEATFGGATVPARGRVGWWYGTDRWSEFFRFTIDDLRPC